MRSGSRATGVTRATLSLIRNWHAAIRADMAVRLGELLGASAELWMRMQGAWDLWIARSHPRLKVLPLAS